MHKAGVYPFIRLLREGFLPKDLKIDVTLYFERKNEKAKEEILRIRLPLFEKDGEHICAVPEPPLGFVGVGPDGKPRDYRREVKKVATNSGISSIFEYFRDLSNCRNKMLYASDSSIPQVSNAAREIELRSNATVLILIFYLLIEPHERQSLVQEALDTYLDIINNLESKAT
ncbi:hypothetical protein [Cellvibrio sp. PSBB006]|uniref:hypothetical protein n=1 Tax=Cellvibrio sp. PSBB006 TaxID=1987723 RepID=UPI000B3B0AE4|nr:hypothetical protein [Cellvibrio sp. PSBB006]ARU28773.1 hypothetical protein CBR65_15740 [Cellvibrio sp. PSBB006]